MSVKIMGKVWEADLSHGEALVLLALADHADHNGENVYPGVGLVAWKTGYSDRQVQRIMDSLIAKGILIEDGRHTDGQTRYKIDLSGAKRKAPYVSRRKLIEGRKEEEKQEEASDKMSDTPSDILSDGGQTFLPGVSDISNGGHDKDRARACGQSPLMNRHEPSHTHSEAQASPSRVRVCGSRFTLGQCRKYANHLKASGEGITNPGGYATTIYRTGEADELIDAWLNPKPALDVNQCPDCHGQGFYYPEGFDKGAKKCKHERLG